MGRIAAGLVALTGAILIGLAGYGLHKAYTHPFEPHVLGAEQVIEVGPTVQATVQRLEQTGLAYPTLFKGYLRLKGLDRKLQPGEILLNSRWNMAQLAQALVSGPRVQYAITFIPGTRFEQAWQSVQQAPKLKHTLPDLAAVKRMLKVAHLEGQLLPETYFYQLGDTDAQVFKRAHQALWRYLEQKWPARQPDLPLKTPYEALVLASIVEKETGVAQERPLIAGVFINRLRRGMRLQSDPTTIYGLGEQFDGNLRKRDLRAHTPYNTYRIKGLPPTPIALASKAAIDAVLHPAKTKALYFVAKGDGTHHFSRTLKEHNRAVQRYQLGQ